MKDWSYFSIRIFSYLLKKIYKYWRKLRLCSDAIISEKNADAPFRLGNIERGVLSVLAKLLFSRLDCIRKLLFTARSQFFHTYTFVIISDSLIPSTWREIIKTATRAEINNNCIILASCETEHRAPATVFADYSVYFVCLHARDNSRPLSSSLFLPGRNFPHATCSISLLQIALRSVSYTCMHACIQEYEPHARRYSLHSRSNKGCNPRASAANLPKDEGWRTGSFKSPRLYFNDVW